MSDVNTKPITMSADEDEVVDVDKLMAEFDKESNTRQFSGIFEKIIKIAMVLFSLYVMFDGWTGTMEERQKMAWFIGIIVFIVAVCIMASLFPRISTGRVLSVIMELCSGMLSFGAIFFISSPIYAPKRTISKCVWGFASGIICMLIRYVSPFEEGACFGFVISCAISDYFDNLPLTSGEKKKIKAQEPYIETEKVTTLVPEEILDEIPDLFTVEIQDENIENNELNTFESESLKDVIAEENAANFSESPFNMGGGIDE